MNDNKAPEPDERTAEECDRHAREAIVSAARMAAAARDVRDPDTLSSMVRATSRYLEGALEDDAKARGRRS